ncbi:replicative DNA helicase [Alkalinema pantanalense CENA528]|uniref:replicative DNA helicase n=1 Tax=Alkalinema pantanalense TaxID=1620705 RepID=UPI003D6EA5B7
MAQEAPKEELNFQAISDRLPPQNLEAEEAILGGILMDPEAIGRITDIVTVEGFYLSAHRRIYEAALVLHQQGKPTDLMNVATWLQDHGQLDKVGGQSRLVELCDRTVSAVNIDQYAQLVMDKYLRRRLIRVGNEISALGHDTTQDLADVLDNAEQKVFNVTQTRPQEGLMSTADVLTQTFAEIESRAVGMALPGLACGFYDLDAMTQGFQRSDLIIVAGRPSMGKCLAAASEILLSDGSLATIETLYQRQSAELLTLNSQLQLQLTEPSAYIDDGIKPLFRVTTRLGRQIETTLTHPYLTIQGWRPLAELTVGDRVAVPRRLPITGSEILRPCEVKLLAYLIGDGCLTHICPSFTNVNPAIQADFTEAVQQFGRLKIRAEDSAGQRAMSFYIANDGDSVAQQRVQFGQRLRTYIQLRIEAGQGSARQLADTLQVSPALICAWQRGETAPNQATFEQLCQVLDVAPETLVPGGYGSIASENALTEWLKQLNLWGKSAHDKTIPDVVFRLERSQLALFLNRLFATDGWATVLASGQSQLGFASVSEKLIRQVQHLLLRFGVIAALKARSVKYQAGRRSAWQLDITDACSIRNFIDEIGIFGKEPALNQVDAAIGQRRYQTNRDLVPVEIWPTISAAKGDESWKSLATRAGFRSTSNIHVGKRSLTRNRLLALATALDHAELQALATSDVYWDEIVAIESVGMGQVYDLTIPDTHNFVANDICVHNTSFVLNVARNIASYHKLPVAVFSLEMSREQLVQRLLSSEVRIESSRLRAGRISNQEWEPLGHAISTLSQMPIFIDDSPNLSVTEMRSRARRLQAENGGALGLILIDYLQLMGSGGNDNRVQALSNITRSLKALARELTVPVIALSQLSRSVESRTDKRPMMSDLRECVTGETLVMLADGRCMPIRDLVGQQPHVLAMTPEEKITIAQSDLVWSVGTKPVFAMKLASGRVLKATAKHRVYTAHGWQELQYLHPGDRVAIARHLPEPIQSANLNDSNSWQDNQLILLGHLIGDGSYLKGQPLRYTTSSEENSQIVADAARSFGVIINRHPGKGNWHQLVFSGNGNRWHPKGINLWLRKLGIFNQRSHAKHLPSSVFTLSNRQVAVLLAHLWATDGTYHVPKSNNTSSRIHLSTCSIRLAHEVATLLLRFGIVARIRTVQQAEFRPIYLVEISGKMMQMVFLEQVGAVGCKVEDAERLKNYLASIAANPNRDTLPQEIFAAIRLRMQEQGITTRQMATLRGTSYGGSSHFNFAPSREVVFDYASLLHDSFLLQKATSDLFWDEIVSITPIGEEEVFDLTVPGPASWLADGIVSHNSGAIEQDADLIMMLYRDEYYNKDTVDRGVAEVIISKHRNGPTGTVKLLFEPQYTQFRNLAAPNRE